MLLQTNSYIVPKEKRAEHARLMRRFRQALHQVGCDNFEVYEQVGANWSGAAASGRFVQIMRFRDRQHQLAVQNAERNDPVAQKLIAEFCELINYPQQQQQQQFVVGFYASAFPVAPLRAHAAGETPAQAQEPDTRGETAENAPSAQSADSLASIQDSQDEKLEETFEETAAALSAEEMPAEDVAAEEGEASAQETVIEEPAGEEVIAEEEFGEPSEASSEESTLSEELPEETVPTGGEPLEEEDLFADEAEPTAEEATTPTDEPASEPEVASELSESQLESDLLGGEEDDDISRLAEELAADDEELHDPRHSDPSLPHRGRTSGNGAH